MEVIDLRLQGLKLIKPKVFRDNRGFFLESFQKPVFEKMGLWAEFPQDNHSCSQKGCVRGLHFQSVPGQAKLIRAAVGTIFDVAVDIRPDSPTFGQWEGVILDDQEHHQLLVPIGFAHGFCVLSDSAHVIYKVSSPYNPQTEKGFRWNDPLINVSWPIENPIISDRDQAAPFFNELNLTRGAQG